MTRRHLSFLLLFLVIQLISVIYFFWFTAKHGYLPAPFSLEKADTFMDLFHPMYWADHAGRYTEWESVYPPLSFLFLKFIKLVLLGSSAQFANAFDLRESAIPVVVFFLLSYLAIPAFVLRTRLWCGVSNLEKFALYIIVTFSPPMLFALERGNLVIFTLIFLALMLSNTGYLRVLCVAVLVNIKPYFALLLLLYWLNRDVKGLWQSISISVGLFLVTGVLLDKHFLLFFYNLFFFAHGVLFSTQVALALPSSISVYSFTLNLEAIQQTTKYSQLLNLKIIAASIEVIKWSVIACTMAMLYRKRALLSDNQILAVILVMTTNLGVSIGGYSLIFYVALLPVFMTMKLSKIYCGLLISLFAPLDLIPVYYGAFSEQYSYITNSAVDVRWILGLGGAIKPILNLSMLILLVIELVRLSSNVDDLHMSPASQANHKLIDTK